MTPASAPLPPVARTAVGVARIRAAESRRPDRLFDDPWARLLVGGDADPDLLTRDGTEPSPQRPGEGLTRRPGVAPDSAALAFHVVVRTRFYDEYLLTAGCAQVVLLGAGLDARAFRLPWPADTRVVELDLPAVLAVKDEVLFEATTRCQRTAVGVDLRGDWRTPLLATGFAPDVPTAWLAEGLLVYLDATDARQLMATVTSLSAAGSRFATEAAAVGRTGAGRTGAADVTRLWKGGLAQDPAAWLDRHGWSSRSHRLGDVAATYGRPAPAQTCSGFVTAVRRQHMTTVPTGAEGR